MLNLDRFFWFVIAVGYTAMSLFYAQDAVAYAIYTHKAITEEAAKS